MAQRKNKHKPRPKPRVQVRFESIPQNPAIWRELEALFVTSGAPIVAAQLFRDWLVKYANISRTQAQLLGRQDLDAIARDLRVQCVEWEAQWKARFADATTQPATDDGS